MAYSDDVKFEGEQSSMSASIGIVQAENKMAKWLMRKGIAKTQAQAQWILLGIAILAIVIGIGVWYLLAPQSGPTGEQLRILENLKGPSATGH